MAWVDVHVGDRFKVRDLPNRRFISASVNPTKMNVSAFEIMFETGDTIEVIGEIVHPRKRMLVCIDEKTKIKFSAPISSLAYDFEKL